MFDRLVSLRENCLRIARGLAVAFASTGALVGAVAHAQIDGNPIVSASFSDATPTTFEPGQLLAGDSVQLQIVFQDFSSNDDFSDFEFTLDLSTIYDGMAIASAVPNGRSDSCAGTSDIATGNETYAYTGGETPAGFNVSCFVSFDISTPAGIPEGAYTLTGARLTGYADGVTNAAFDVAIPDASFTVVGDTTSPDVVISVPGDFLPDAPFDVAFAFSEPVDGFELADIVVTGATLSDFVVGEPGAEAVADFNDSFSVTVTPTGAGTVSISLGAAAAQDESDNDSTSASASVEIIEPATLDVAFVEDPVDPSDTITLRYTITNGSSVNAMSGVRVDLGLTGILSGLTAGAPLPGTPCGASSSMVGTTTLVMIGGDIAAGGSCTFDVPVVVPAAPDAGTYSGGTSNFQYTIDGIAVAGDPVSVSLTVAGGEGGGAPLAFSMDFLDAAVSPTESATLEFTIAPAEGTDASNLAFTLDLDAVISGAVGTGLPLADACGTGSTVSGTSTVTLAGGNLNAGEACTFEFEVSVPAGASGGAYVFDTSNLTGDQDDGVSVTAINADPASSQLTVNSPVPTATITGPATDVGASFLVDIRFSEGISGFVVGDLNVTNGVASDLTAVSAADYTATITPSAAGAVSVQLPADSVLDADLNGNLISNLFSVTAVTPEPEITVSGLGVGINDGDTSPISIDGTSFGSTDTTSGTIDRTFTIANDGTGDLTLAGGPSFVAVSGADAADFSVLSQPTSPIAAGASTTFQIRYDPSAVATDVATITITSDDADEGIFTFDISGSGTTAPEINVTGNGVNVVDGSTTPSATNDTLFGAVNLGESLSRTFTIENLGSAVLTLGDDAVQLVQSGSDYSVTSQPATTVAIGSSTTFEITFSPTVYESQAVSVLISNNDSDENPYNFGLSGEGAGGPDVSLTGLALTIADEDATPSANDGTDFGSTNVGVALYRTFTIENNGTTDLVLSVAPADRAGDTVGSTTVDVFGSSDFSIFSQPSSPVAAGGTTSFTVQFLPTSTGTAAATTIAFGTDDFDTPRYDFTVTAFGTTPQIDVLGESLAIADGDATPRTDDGTLFASLDEDSGTDSQTFTIENNGDGPLTLGASAVSLSGAASGDYSVTTQPATSVAAGNSTTFTIEFDPTTTGSRAATVSIANDDLDEAPYTFDIEGEGLDVTAPTGFTVAFDDSLIGASEAGSTSFSFTGAEVGADYDYTISSDGGGADVTSSGTIATATDTISGIDVSGLGDGELTLSVTLTDAFTNESDAETDTTDLDQTDPDVTITGPATTQVGAFTATFTFTESVTGFALGDIDVGNGAASGLAGSGAVYTATITPSADGSVTVDVDASVAQDAAGNDNTAATQFSVDADITAPDLTITGPATTQVGAFTATFTFTESVTGFAVGDIDVGNGAASGLAGSGAVYTATITPSADGAVTVDVDAAAAQDAAGNDNTAATQFSVDADVTAPDLTITGPSATQVGAFTATFTFTESVTGFALGDIDVGNGAASGLAGSGAVYTATITPSADGSVTVDVDASVAQDAAGNDNTAATQFSVEADITAPDLTITGPSATQVGAFTATFTFTESVTGFAVGDIDVGNGTASGLAGSGAVYTATITPDVDGSVTVDVDAGAAQDAAGNDNTAATQFSVDADVTVPTVSISGPGGTQVGAFSVTFTFSEDVTGFALGDIDVGNGSAGTFAGSGDTYTATITPAADGTVTVDISAGVAQDAAGNDNTAATQFSTDADITAPDLTISGPSTTQVGPFTVTFTFTESVTGFGLGDVDVGNGAASGFAGSGAVYTATITPAGDGTVTVNADAAVAQDAAGNDNNAAAEFSVEADITAPTLVISGPAVTQTGTFTATFTFSEDVSGFSLGDISVGNGSAGSLAGSGDTYTADITPAANGTVTVDVAADAASDDAGNGNTAASQYSVDADITIPTVSITGPSATQTGAFTVTVTFSEDVTGFDLGDLDVANGTAGSFAGADDVYTATITPTADGSVTVDLAADAAVDAAGNGNAVATQFSVEADLTAPGLSITGPAATQVGAFSVTFTFTEDVTGFALGDISVGNGTATDLAGSGDVYTATITPSADGSVTVDVAAAVAIDAAGNDNTAAAQFSVDADITAPGVDLDGPVATQTAAFTLDVTFTENVSGFALGDIVVGNGTASGLAGSDDTYSVTITPSADGTVTVDVAAGVAQDAAGNSNTAATQFSVDADVTAPSVTVTGPTVVQAGAFTVDVDFSESVTGFALADITVGNGSASSLIGSGTSYAVTITPVTDGEVTVDVAADVAVDAAGNGNTAATQFAVDTDLTAPTVEITGPATVQTGAFSITATFTEDVTGFALADLAAGNATVSNLSGTGAVYTATITPDSEGSVTVDIAADVAADEAGNGNTAAAQFSTDADLSVPTLVSLVISDGDLRIEDIGTSVTLVATFSEALDAGTEPTIAFSQDMTGTLSQTASAFSSGDTVYTVTYTVIDGGDSLADVDVTVSDAADTAGNALAEITVEDVVSVEMRRGSVTIAEAIDGAADAEFPFSGDLGDFSITTVGQAGSQLFTDLAEGEYSISVAEVDGFTLQSISCDIGSVVTDVADGSVTITVAPTDTITCTFETLAEPDIDETTIPEVTLTLPSVIDDPAAQSASFDLDNTGGAPFYFTAVTDAAWLDIDPTSGAIPASGSLEFTITFNDAVLDLDPGSYTATITITETASASAASKAQPSANDLVTIEIPVTIQLAPREGNLTIIATTSSAAAGEGVFTYSSSLPDLDGLSLSTAGGSASSDALTVLRGSYTLDQLATEGWDLASIACVGDTDGGSVLDPANGRVTIDLDPEEEIVCTFANTRNEDYIRLVTQSAIRSFMAARADQILTQSPELAGRMRGDRSGATPSRFAADFTEGRFNANMSTSLSALRESAQQSDPQMPGSDQFNLAGQTGMASVDVWVQASFSSVDDNRAGLNAETNFGLYYLGADFMANENLLVGALVQYDQAETVTGELRSQVEGDGWLAGPYIVARLAENVYFDARGAWGQSDNEVNPIGTYTDTFETDRWLLQANLTGDILRGNWRFSPEVGIAYFNEEQAAYTDTLGFYIPSQEITIGRINAGPEIAYRFNYHEGGYLEPYLQINALYDYDDAEVLNAVGQLQTLGFLRADARLGLTAEMANGGRITGEVSMMGIGEGEFEANSAMIRIRIPLSMQQ